MNNCKLNWIEFSKPQEQQISMRQSKRWVGVSGSQIVWALETVRLSFTFFSIGWRLSLMTLWPITYAIIIWRYDSTFMNANHLYSKRNFKNEQIDRRSIWFSSPESRRTTMLCKHIANTIGESIDFRILQRHISGWAEGLCSSAIGVHVQYGIRKRWASRFKRRKTNWFRMHFDRQLPCAGSALAGKIFGTNETGAGESEGSDEYIE